MGMKYRERKCIKNHSHEVGTEELLGKSNRRSKDNILTACKGFEIVAQDPFISRQIVNCEYNYGTLSFLKCVKFSDQHTYRQLLEKNYLPVI
jgi:hypothetical protein